MKKEAILRDLGPEIMWEHMSGNGFYVDGGPGKLLLENDFEEMNHNLKEIHKKYSTLDNLGEALKAIANEYPINKEDKNQWWHAEVRRNIIVMGFIMNCLVRNALRKVSHEAGISEDKFLEIFEEVTEKGGEKGKGIVLSFLDHIFNPFNIIRNNAQEKYGREAAQMVYSAAGSLILYSYEYTEVTKM